MHEEVANVLGAMQRFQEWSKLFDNTRVLSAVDPWWMLASKQVVAPAFQRLVARGAADSESRFAFPEGGFYLGDDVSPSQLTLLLRKSTMMTKLGTRVCEFHVFCGVDWSTSRVVNCASLCRQVRAA